MKKLLIISPSTHRGGIEEYALTLATAAVKQAWQVRVALPPTPAHQALIADFQAIGVEYTPLAIAETVVMPAATLSELLKTLGLRLQTIFEKPIHAWRILLCLLRHQPDVVVVNLPWAAQGLTSLLVCALLNFPTAVVFHLIPWRFEFSPLKLNLYRWARERRQTWIAISENNRQLISASFQCPASQVTRIYNGATPQGGDLSSQPAAGGQQPIRQTLGLSETCRILLTVARLDSQKGYDYLIPTLPHLLKQFPDIHFAWVGEGDQKAALERQLETYGVRSAVSLLGYRQDVPQLLQAADLFVFPSHYEGFPFAVLEAMAAGVPIVASATNAIPELIEDGIHGRLCRTGDSCDLLETLRWALQHPDAMQMMAEQASNHVARFSEVAMIQETLAALETIGGSD